ncbi:ArnT family glycosyltransferase [Paludibacterium yongneupense]|uniref:ArnT family glycosyltransferase n=1 Tax=Paludibacterium yongneupense TaxID=400061 RepID=UPI00048F4D12|nr:hypothetical protein [Paludibacterium yongneupense]
MLTYTPNSKSALPQPTEKPWVLLLLALIWLWPGILGHDPWRPDEPYVLAVASEMLQTGHWLMPTIQGQPYLAAPPLYSWVAAAFIQLLSPWLLPAHDAARLATPFFMALTLLFAGGAGRELIGRRHGRSVVMILIGCIGLTDTGHQMTPMVATLTGFAAAFYALVRGLRSPALAGALLGAASVVLFLSSSLLEVMLLWSVVLMLPAFSAWRRKPHAIMVAMAVLFGLPLSLIWPVGFAHHFPAEFAIWWQHYALGPLDGFARLGLFHGFGYYFKTSVWYAWPAWPLAGWTLYRSRRYDEPVLQLPLMFFGVVMVLLTLSDRQGAEYTMPLLLPLAMLAAVELDSLKRGAAAFLNWFALMTFGFFGLLIWFGWAAMNYGWPAELAERARFFSPYYRVHISWLGAGCALLATLVWVWALTRRNLRGRQALTNWSAGITLFWGLAMTLWLPWLDATKSYRPVVGQMLAALPPGARNACIAVPDALRLARISWAYYGGLHLLPYLSDSDIRCDWRLVQRQENEPESAPGWRAVWSGSRPRDKREVYTLQQRLP